MDAGPINRFATAVIGRAPFKISDFAHHFCRGHRPLLQHRFTRLAQRILNGTILQTKKIGGVVEWLMAPVLKTGRAKALVGSNPTPSAPSSADCRLRIAD